METWLEVNAILPWVKHPTQLGTYTQGDYGEIHTLCSDDNGKTWFIPFGMRFRSDQIEMVTTPIKYRERWTWCGRIKEEVK